MNCYISKQELDTKCWWCGAQVRGFSVELGRNIHTIHRHFCNNDCYNAFKNAPFTEEE